MFGIWCFDTNDWLRELPSKVDDGGIAILAFDAHEAGERAAKHYGFDSYRAVRDAGWCTVRLLESGPHPEVRQSMLEKTNAR